MGGKAAGLEHLYPPEMLWMATSKWLLAAPEVRERIQNSAKICFSDPHTKLHQVHIHASILAQDDSQEKTYRDKDGPVFNLNIAKIYLFQKTPCSRD